MDKIWSWQSSSPGLASLSRGHILVKFSSMRQPWRFDYRKISGTPIRDLRLTMMPSKRSATITPALIALILQRNSPGVGDGRQAGEIPAEIGHRRLSRLAVGPGPGEEFFQGGAIRRVFQDQAALRPIAADTPPGARPGAGNPGGRPPG